MFKVINQDKMINCYSIIWEQTFALNCRYWQTPMVYAEVWEGLTKRRESRKLGGLELVIPKP